MKELFTIGVYGFDADTFFEALQGAHIDLFLDIRRRRGVRGREYAFANVGRLTRELEARGIAYRHLIDLAPTQTTRELQSRRDAADRIARRARQQLSDEFIADYMEQTIEPFDWDALVRDLQAVERPVLCCVERTPQACHRHLVARELAGRTEVPVRDLLP